MKITMIGAGAIGGVLGAYLVNGGHDITFVDICEEHVNAMKSRGLTIQLPQGKTFSVPVNALTVAEIKAKKEALGMTFLCVKAQATVPALENVRELIREATAVVSCQNGLCEYEIAKLIGPERTIGCFVNLFADYIEPGVINYGGEGAVYIGEIDGSRSARVSELSQVLSEWGPVHTTGNIFGYLWSKLGYVTMLIGTALTDETIADVFENKEMRNILLDTASESLAVAESCGIETVGFDDWNPQWAYPAEKRDWEEIDREMAIHVARLRTYTKTKSGIWRDLAVRKRKTEVPSQLQPVIERARAANIAVPRLEKLLSMIIEIEEGKRGLALENISELALMRQNGFY
ncbi:MAG TPA: 2-dehydropantoate 2-reductase N-terminal domain-containing protein [Patescibacteria group bacterium]|nr:2-dehydropantoate 2-reductase N-terminal domain-containing protein [Patescibacteria group bacterium]